MEKKIYTYLINEGKLKEYYEFLIRNNYNVKIFDKKKDNKVYELYLPQTRNQLFWTFNLTGNKKVFKDLSDSLKASVCLRYDCNIFEKDERKIICFNNGICFAITEDKNEVIKLKSTKTNMESINLRDEQSYDIPQEIRKKEKEEYIYLYILQLYKMIFMHKVLKEIQTPARFNKVRTEFVTFIEKICNTRATDNPDAIAMCIKWEEALDLERLQLRIDNEIDLIYRNNKLNDNIRVQRICILLFVITIIIGTINLWGLMQ